MQVVLWMFVKPYDLINLSCTLTDNQKCELHASLSIVSWLMNCESGTRGTFFLPNVLTAEQIFNKNILSINYFFFSSPHYYPNTVKVVVFREIYNLHFQNRKQVLKNMIDADIKK